MYIPIVAVVQGTAMTARTLVARLPELTHVEIGPGLHYLQQDHPGAIGCAVAAWHATRTGTPNPFGQEV